jgi:hypothetical protein
MGNCDSVDKNCELANETLNWKGDLYRRNFEYFEKLIN